MKSYLLVPYQTALERIYRRVIIGGRYRAVYLKMLLRWRGDPGYAWCRLMRVRRIDGDWFAE